MSLNQLNFFIGVVVGVALYVLLRSGTPPGREAKTLYPNFTRDKAG